MGNGYYLFGIPKLSIGTVWWWCQRSKSDRWNGRAYYTQYAQWLLWHQVRVDLRYYRNWWRRRISQEDQDAPYLEESRHECGTTIHRGSEMVPAIIESPECKFCADAGIWWIIHSANGLQQLASRSIYHSIVSSIHPCSQRTEERVHLVYGGCSTFSCTNLSYPHIWNRRRNCWQNSS